jgi:hypothetical protein
MGSQNTKDDVKDDVDNMPVLDGKEILIKKLMRSSEYRDKLKSIQVVEKFASVLSDIAELKRAYLNLDWTETFKLYEENRTQSDKETTDHVNTETNFSSTSQDTVTDEKIEEITTQEMKEVVNELSVKKDIKVKLIISEIAHSSARKQLRQFVSPILMQLDLAPTFGMFHSALQVGPFLLEWNNSAIAIPRKCMSRAAILSLDVEAIHTTDRIEEVINKMAEYIVRWNTTMEYAERPKNRKVEGNCQDFIDGLLKKLEINVNFDGCVGKYLENLRRVGRSDLEFSMDPEFRQHFGVKEKSVIFKTHIELDTFVKMLVSVNPEFGITWYKKEYQLIKSFDRAFWMRHFKFPNEKDYVSLVEGEDEECKCPFGNPLETSSIVFV